MLSDVIFCLNTGRKTASDAKSTIYAPISHSYDMPEMFTLGLYVTEPISHIHPGAGAMSHA